MYFITFLLSLVCFFGPVFYKKNNLGDLEALRAQNKRRGGQGGRNFDEL